MIKPRIIVTGATGKTGRLAVVDSSKRTRGQGDVRFQKQTDALVIVTDQRVGFDGRDVSTCAETDEQRAPI